MKQRRVEKPCLICGHITDDWDYICSTCRINCDIGKRYKEEQQAQLASEELITAVIHDTIGSPSDDLVTKANVHHRHNYAVQVYEALYEILDGKPAFHWNGQDIPIHGCENETELAYATSRVMSHRTYGKLHTTKAKAEAASKLLRAIQWLCAANLKLGYSNGSSLLLRISSGEVSIDEINDAFSRTRNGQKREQN